jgi:hypothetical protein
MNIITMPLYPAKFIDNNHFMIATSLAFRPIGKQIKRASAKVYEEWLMVRQLHREIGVASPSKAVQV